MLTKKAKKTEEIVANLGDYSLTPEEKDKIRKKLLAFMEKNPAENRPSK